MQVLLGLTILFAVVWFVALRPKSNVASPTALAPTQTAPAASSGAAPGVQGLGNAIDKAHNAVTTADGDAQRASQSSADGAGAAASAGTGSRSAAASHSGSSASRSSTGAHAGAKAHARAHSAARAHAKAVAATHRSVRTVRTALRQHKAVAIGFVDPNTADARAVARELSHVSRFHGRAVAVAVPLVQLSSFPFITNRVQVTVAPTVVIVDPHRRATTIVGFADRGEIEQRLADALAVKRG